LEYWKVGKMEGWTFVDAMVVFLKKIIGIVYRMTGKPNPTDEEFEMPE